ncbi:MAG: polysaccharide export protein [Candidatus Acidoferrum typicum]|nr:polysaccharide export protein [Candidatus Acidoferrum typicum]
MKKIFALAIIAAVTGSGAYGQSAAIKAQPENKLTAAKNGAAYNSPIDLSAKSATDDPNYLIGPEDELIISVWKEPDISRTVPVRPDGKISLALLNDVQATGRTPMQLGSDITEKLKSFISEPQVTVIVARINSQRIFVVGEVPRTGSYTLLPNMTAVDAISSAGGFTPFAKRTKIYILRKENGKMISIPFNYKEVVKNRRSEQDVALRAGDRIVVP